MRKEYTTMCFLSLICSDPSPTVTQLVKFTLRRLKWYFMGGGGDPFCLDRIWYNQNLSENAKKNPLKLSPLKWHGSRERQETTRAGLYLICLQLCTMGSGESVFNWFLHGVGSEDVSENHRTQSEYNNPRLYISHTTGYVKKSVENSSEHIHKYTFKSDVITCFTRNLIQYGEDTGHKQEVNESTTHRNSSLLLWEELSKLYCRYRVG